MNLLYIQSTGCAGLTVEILAGSVMTDRAHYYWPMPTRALIDYCYCYLIAIFIVNYGLLIP